MKKTGTRTVSYMDAKRKGGKKEYILIPILLIMGVLPFITRYIEYQPKLIDYAWFSNKETTEDLYLIGKQVFLIFVSFLMLLIGIYNYKKQGKTLMPKYIYLLLGYLLLAIISTVVSPWRYWGITGVFEHFESVFVQISYVIILFYCFTIPREQEQIDKILKFFLGSIVLMLLIGFSQGIGKDVLTTKLATFFIFPMHIWENLKSFSMEFPRGMVYMTLYNPNYAGVYMAMILPILVAMIFYFTNRYVKVGIGVLTGLAVFVLIRTQSEAGMITIAMFFVVAVVFLRNKMFKSKKLFLASTIFFLGLVAGIGVTKADKIGDFFINQADYTTNLQRILTEERLTVQYGNQVAKILYSIEGEDVLVSVLDQNDNWVDYSYSDEEGYYTINLPGWEHIQMRIGLYQEEYAMMLNIDGKEWYFTNQLEDGTFYYINDYRKLVKIIEADYTLDKKFDRFASGRGFIWSRTIPILKDTLLLGNGADSFIFTFPNNDYVNVMNSGFDGIIVNKPHNMYLQIGIESGILSLILFLGFFVIYFVKGCRLYWKSTLNTWNQRIGLALFLSVLSYLFISLTNDSFITVAPVFWCITGISLRMNYNNSRSNIA